MRRTGFAIAGAAAALAFASPAYAINDALVPAGHCANSPSAVGTPGGGPNPGLATADPVGIPASGNNPGQSRDNPSQPDGARGEEHSQAPCSE